MNNDTKLTVEFVEPTERTEAGLVIGYKCIHHYLHELDKTKPDAPYFHVKFDGREVERIMFDGRLVRIYLKERP